MTYNYKVAPCSRLEIRNYADYFRDKTKLSNELAYPIVEVFELLAETGYYDYEIVPIKDMPNSYGETLKGENLIRIREDIYEKACEDDGFSRSTIAHELLHFFKHRQEEIVFCRTVEEMKSRKAYEDPEWQANCFAGELLVPKRLVKNLSVEEVVEQCKVTQAMASIQLRQYKKEGW
ncbi:ImmA/IrrE family metallo-endopeptidase [Streptococcus oralis]|uniref:ImmA/IrrE family metallo-endopeptidase n=1 Tax=Streptococcus oralis TaxID=1303 RepID=UPI002284BF56|nr:ImmA/IrrE family metallo-endopeptidase [Streptococcus oralis]MCY7103321.1 ImmA/IrrE family metallo-endopeptidase [Streptococcus oralis]